MVANDTGILPLWSVFCPRSAWDKQLQWHIQYLVLQHISWIRMASWTVAVFPGFPRRLPVRLTTRCWEKRNPASDQQMEGFPPEFFFSPCCDVIFIGFKGGVGWPWGAARHPSPRASFPGGGRRAGAGGIAEDSWRGGSDAADTMTQKPDASRRCAAILHQGPSAASPCKRSAQTYYMQFVILNS